MSESILKTKSFALAKEIVFFYKSLVNDQREYVMSKQMLRSGTAVAALIRESKNAESNADFIHKMAIAQKECDETLFWLELIYETGYCEKKHFEQLHSKTDEVLRMLKSAIITTKNKIAGRK